MVQSMKHPQVFNQVMLAGQVGALHVAPGYDVVVNHPVGLRVETLIKMSLVDALIVDSEDGFSQLGQMRDFVSADLGIQRRDLVRYVLAGFPNELERNISSLADWNRAREEAVTLVAIPSERSGSCLRGLILSPYDGSEVYKKFSYPGYRAHRDFMYSVTYEAISYAYNRWGARRIAVTHLARSKYDRDVTTCQVEAMVHFASTHPNIESFTFLDDFRGNFPIEIVEEFNCLTDCGSHRPLKTAELEFWGICFIDLDLTSSFIQTSSRGSRLREQRV
jgi:hypothetical protein